MFDPGRPGRCGARLFVDSHPRLARAPAVSWHQCTRDGDLVARHIGVEVAGKDQRRVARQRQREKLFPGNAVDLLALRRSAGGHHRVKDRQLRGDRTVQRAAHRCDLKVAVGVKITQSDAAPPGCRAVPLHLFGVVDQILYPNHTAVVHIDDLFAGICAGCLRDHPPFGQSALHGCARQQRQPDRQQNPPPSPLLPHCLFHILALSPWFTSPAGAPAHLLV